MPSAYQGSSMSATSVSLQETNVVGSPIVATQEANDNNQEEEPSLMHNRDSKKEKNAHLNTHDKKARNNKTRPADRELRDLLDDVTKYHPQYDYSLPRTFLRSSTKDHKVRGKEHGVDQLGEKETEGKSPMNQKNSSLQRLKKQRALNKAKKLDTTGQNIVKETFLAENKVNSTHNKFSSSKRKKLVKEKDLVSVKTKKIKKRKPSPTPEAALDSNSSTPSLSKENSIMSLTRHSESMPTPNEGLLLPPDYNNNDDEHDKNNLFKEVATDRKEHIKEDFSSTTFVDWSKPTLKLQYPIFNIEELSQSNFYFDELPIQSTTLTKNVYAHDPENCKLVKLQNPLFANYQEEYHIDFNKDFEKYNPMSEIGKIIEYTTYIYLPEPFSDQIKIDIIPRLNDAFDNSEIKNFISAIEDYNSSIKRIPRYKIIEHLATIKEVPISFIHDFLHIVYTRAIHPNVNKLKGYKAFSNFVYGELLPSFLSELFGKCDLNSTKTFMDLGSGVGNCVIQASLEYGCEKSFGCEIMPQVCHLTELQQVELQRRSKLFGFTPSDIEFSLRKSFVNNTRVDQLIPKCDVLLINNFLFDSALNKEVEKIIQNCKPGCKIVTLKNLRSFGYTIDFFNIENILNRLKVERIDLKEDSVSWTHNGGEYFIATVLENIDESLFEPEVRSRATRRPTKYSR
ncbi:histone methyltransferase DOT1 NDAI_0H01750 [Naumovozyma dairenensis CBS 421]|uniref:Histone-lysine N-methyltransferase, H3 lysine-79 specific n=1 Tax=Naumovozyma dairenensis (strain ATCC 10597 / BCRC 20456 / CBS 421 / NBRC 0211 / NRRL Y-12639) TaxID=1071378 RepID=G0WEY8_NAUDC|nr:hypothetical protein NDAI_0H01750 [Naumovozyma dairenensis CBS 421]CCD26349.1 hypothetical protein NDAI_0H01750 [Naumovozyma dairenensis CBS 421]